MAVLEISKEQWRDIKRKARITKKAKKEKNALVEEVSENLHKMWFEIWGIPVEKQEGSSFTEYKDLGELTKDEYRKWGKRIINIVANDLLRR